MKRMILALVVLSLAAAASAQTGVTITALTMQVFNSATPITGTPIGTPISVPWPIAVGSCNLVATPVPVGTVINPTSLEIDDPAVTGRKCLLNFAAYFAALPAATGYKATTTFTYSDSVVSARSAATGFFDEVLAVHAAPTSPGVR